MKEYTFSTFIEVLQAFIKNNYKILPIYLYQEQCNDKVLFLRHDVDRYPDNALKMAIMEHDLGIKSSYYFRIIKNVYKEDIIKKIIDLGHEVSYHYEDLSICKGDFEKAIKHFEYQLNRFRKLVPAKTICRHGSPLSNWDNKMLWEKYDYRDFGIDIDTEHDINFEECFYITDNGWGWNNTAVSVRDKVKSGFNIPINSTSHFLELIDHDQLPTKVMLNAHPDTFFEPGFRWFLNKTILKSKNIIKRQIVKYQLLNNT